MKTNLATLRNHKGYTQITLAKVLGVSNGAIAMWETGAREPNIKTILMLCDILECTSDELLGRDSTEKITETESEESTMTDTEFLTRLPEGTEAPTDEDFELIQFVYNYHPCLDPAEGKNQIAMLYSIFGMRIILDMQETAKRAQEIETERRQLRTRIDELDEEYEAIKAGLLFY